MVESDFPSLVNSTKNNENWINGHTFDGHTSDYKTVSSIILGFSTS